MYASARKMLKENWSYLLATLILAKGFLTVKLLFSLLLLSKLFLLNLLDRLSTAISRSLGCTKSSKPSSQAQL